MMRLADRHLVALSTLAVVVVAALLTSKETVLGATETVAGDPLLFAGAVILLYALRPLVLWPTTLVAVAVGYGFGIALGFPIALAGAVFTSIPAYYAGRWVAAGWDCGTAARLASAGDRFFDTTGDLRGVVAGRLAPVPADAVSAAAGMGGVRLRVLAVGILVGELPWTIAAVVVGNSLHTISTAGLGSVGTQLGVVTTLAALLLLAGPAYEHFVDGGSTVGQ
ncbi:TVP38/TMEM64 family protein [Natranaeroarchaeum sulfidigenes]|uniref:Putative membrane protein YdjX, TVP38/TMEM64 family, SNARE-associated domain n=1 Tax=Natranaeroarchaeum sulfidigenes TaxID=2784880 RepID=A0A897N0E6_9EURY|nr:VTT domain-containing protein [Natranaeroarchaeum sulfidigenes]QSG04115.1 putative membrane protein YdjX, TVP38/TMEM64 family, SNARE-associated domain [Natranaeroarchaeum sulfidigenes]